MIRKAVSAIRRFFSRREPPSLPRPREESWNKALRETYTPEMVSPVKCVLREKKPATNDYDGF